MATCTFGGTCERPAVIKIVRADGIYPDGDPFTRYGCKDHEPDLILALAHIVPGWGDVVGLTLTRIRHGDALQRGHRNPYRDGMFLAPCLCGEVFKGGSVDEAEFLREEHCERMDAQQHV